PGARPRRERAPGGTTLRSDLSVAVEADRARTRERGDPVDGDVARLRDAEDGSQDAVVRLVVAQVTGSYAGLLDGPRGRLAESSRIPRDLSGTEDPIGRRHRRRTGGERRQRDGQRRLEAGERRPAVEAGHQVRGGGARVARVLTAPGASAGDA